MAKVPLLGGAYQARSLIADCQRCVNLFPENNPQGAASPVTHYLSPGLTLLAQAAVARPVRGLYTTSVAADARRVLACVGNKVYRLNPDFSLTELGTVGTYFGMVSFQDNGIDVLLVDGSSSGYVINLESWAFSTYSQDGFYGANRVRYLDTFLLFNRPGTRQFSCTLSNTTDLDPTDIASKTGNPDPIVTLAVTHREIWLLGIDTTEVWYDSGGQGTANSFPFELFPGAYIDHGCEAKWSVAEVDEAVFWLSRDKEGHAFVLKGQNYQVKKVSNHAIEQLLNSYGDLSDAVAWIYQSSGHTFYVLSLPSADVTWAFDSATDQWHQLAWRDSDGVLHRHRAQCHAYCYGKHIVGDWENGRIYALDSEALTDNGDPIQRLRTFPHMITGFGPDGQPQSADGKEIEFLRFIADMESGNWEGSGAEPPEVLLRWSDTKGRSWGSYVAMPLGTSGEYLTSVQWLALGQGRDRVFELSWDAPVKTALNGAYIDPLVLLG